MNNHEYKDALEALSLSPTEAASLIGVECRTSRRYASGERPIPEPAARFLNCLIAMGITPEAVIDKIGPYHVPKLPQKRGRKKKIGSAPQPI